MCPLRLILIFLSATLAGFFVLRNLKSHQPLQEEAAGAEDLVVKDPDHESSKDLQVRSAFWTCVDMASGRYLWRHLVSASSKSSD
ncbi:hypothetical protein I3842_13G064700 [Carya illinoinensis]|uniref:Methyltransferase-related protein n=1 Tax=Carya illinoinensis TaxID=32201 RepID=A0A922ANP7_CARIL|nr:hypothetical protein I3842_13G064700 [Carya illinoinensis]